MTNLKTKVAGALAVATLMMNVTVPAAFAAVSCTITGNGSDSSSTCDFASLNQVSVDQSNDLSVKNDVHVDSNTGNNDAKDNTGGDVSVDTGDAKTDVTADTSGNTNTADVQGTSSSSDFNLNISGNGTDTDNKAEVDVTDQTSVDQNNDASVHNDVDVHSNTGKNDANDNTGGNVDVTTGDAQVNSGVQISTAVNANSATVGNTGGNGDLSINIEGNGSHSDNNADLALLSEVTVDQNNDANVHNDVDVHANTGYNDAKDNTGGDVSVDTGDAKADVTLDTMANFNQADVQGGFLGDVTLGVDGNGTHSDNKVEINLIDEQAADQANDGYVHNDANLDTTTGKNDANDNTSGDTNVQTGDTNGNVETTTTTNANVFGADSHVEFSFDINELLNLFNALSALFH